MRLTTAIDGYFLHRQDLAAKTVQRYRWAYNMLIDFLGDVHIERITADDVRHLLDHARRERGLSNRSLYDVWTALSSLWTWASRELGVPHVVRQVQRPRYNTPPVEPFTEDEIRALLSAAEYGEEWTTRGGRRTRSRRPTARRDRAMLLVMLDTGIRVSELCALTMGDYDPERGRIFIRRGKGNKRRFVYLGTTARRAMWRYLADRQDARPGDPLFATGTNRFLRPDNVYNMMQSLGKRAGVHGVHPHRFRHTFALQFLRNGGNAFELQRILGHEDMATVRVYVNLARLDLDEAIRRSSPVDNWRI